MPIPHDLRTEIERRWLAGESAGDIQRTLRGVTRNQILGHCSRKYGKRDDAMRRSVGAKHLSHDGTSQFRGVRTSPSRAPEIRPSLANDCEPDIADLTPLPGRCKFPIGEPRLKGFHFCNAEKVEGRPYCPRHLGVAFPALAQSA